MSRSRLSLILSLFLGLVVLTAPGQCAVPVATVQTLLGAATYRAAGGTQLQPLRIRRSLFVGDVVATGPRAKLTLLFRDGAQIRLNAGTAVQINASSGAHGKENLLRVLGGEIWARLRPGNSLQTKTAALGVLGTEIELAVAPDGASTLTVIQGSVDFRNDLGRVTVNTSQQSVAREGAAPTAPVTIENAGFTVEWTLDLNRALIPRERFYVSLDPAILKTELAQRQAKAQANPNDVAAQRDYADVLFDKGDYETALATYQNAEKLAPGDSPLKTRLGYTFLELDQVDAARQSFAAARGEAEKAEVQMVALTADEQNGVSKPDTAAAAVGLAWLELGQDRPAAAQQWAKSAIGSLQTVALQNAPAGTEAEALLVQGVAAMRQPDLPTAKAALTQAAGSDSRFAYQAKSWLALAQLADGEAAATASAREAVASQPYSGLAHGNLAMVLFFNGQQREAQVEAKQATVLNPRSIAARVVQGQVALARGDVDSAEVQAAQAVALDPSLPQAHYLLGVAQASRRDYGHATRSLNESLRLAPDFLPSAAALATVYNFEGRPQEAVSLLTDLLPRYGQTEEVLASLGAVSYEQGNYAKSTEYLRQASAKRPASALYRGELTRALLYSNRLNEAIIEGQEAVRLAPQVGQYHSLLGLALEFSGLRVQAEREYREAILRDPQNSLALTRLAEFADERPGAARRLAVGSDTQAFLLDPGVSRQLLRGGIDTEILPVAASDKGRDLGLTHRLTSSQGRFNAIGFLNRNTDEGPRTNADARTTDASAFATYAPGAKTNFYATARGVRNNNGLFGADTAPVTDDRQQFRYEQAQVALRHRQSAASELWVGLFGNTSRSLTRDPGLDSFIDPSSGLPVQRQNFNSDALMPEIRFDHRFSDRGEDTRLLTMGLTYAQTNFSSDRRLQFPIPTAAAFQRFNQDNNVLMGYAQWTQRVGDKLGISGQLRVQRRDREERASLSRPALPLVSSRENSDLTRVLPSFMASYHADKNTTMRLSFNRQVTDITTSTFAPVDILTASEVGALPFGTPDTLQTVQFDVERYLGTRSFVKMFAFNSKAADLQIGGSDLTGLGVGLPAANAPILGLDKWRATGVGARLEQQLLPNLFANASVVARRTSSSTAGALFDGSRAPYEANLLGALGLNYIDRSGNKLGLQMRHTGSFFADVPGALSREKFPAKFYFDLRLAREPSAHGEVFIGVTNLFNARQIQFNDYRVGRRRLEFGVNRRF